MSVDFDLSLLDELRKLLTARSGLRLGSDPRRDLERGICSAYRELGFNDPVECARWLVSSPPSGAQIRVLASHFTVPETYFFREKASFQALEEDILPELIRTRCESNRQLRLWSAGCCTGEEAYSMAISLARVLPNQKEWNITLLATDINQHYLEIAKEGVYGKWSFRDNSNPPAERFFDCTGSGLFRVLPDLRRRVLFAPLNLAEDDYPSSRNDTSGVDVIFCRNVLIYFNEECIERIVGKLNACLSEGGWLLVGAAEGSLVRSGDLVGGSLPGVMAFQKRKGAEDAAMFSPMIEKKAPAAAPVMAPRDSIGPAKGDQSVVADASMADAVKEYEQRHYAHVVKILLPHCLRVCGDTDSLELLARAYANQGDSTEAFAWCEKAILNEKMNPRLHYLRAAILQERGDLAEANASYRRTIYLDPDFVMAHVGAAQLALRLGKRKEAGEHFLRASRLLHQFAPDQAVPEADGLDAGHLAELIATGRDRDRSA